MGFDKKKKANVAKTSLPYCIPFQGRTHFMGRYNKSWCGLNCINNLFGEEVVSYKQFHKECRRMTKSGDSRMGNHQEGTTTIGMSFCFVCHTTADARIRSPSFANVLQGRSQEHAEQTKRAFFLRRCGCIGAR